MIHEPTYQGKQNLFSLLYFFRKLFSTSSSLTPSTIPTKCKIFFLVANFMTTKSLICGFLSSQIGKSNPTKSSPSSVVELHSISSSVSLSEDTSLLFLFLLLFKQTGFKRLNFLWDAAMEQKA